MIVTIYYFSHLTSDFSIKLFLIGVTFALYLLAVLGTQNKVLMIEEFYSQLRRVGYQMSFPQRLDIFACTLCEAATRINETISNALLTYKDPSAGNLVRELEIRICTFLKQTWAISATVINYFCAKGRKHIEELPGAADLSLKVLPIYSKRVIPSLEVGTTIGNVNEYLVADAQKGNKTTWTNSLIKSIIRKAQEFAYFYYFFLQTFSTLYLNKSLSFMPLLISC